VKEGTVLIFTQYYLGCLSHASYLVGDTTTGRAVVVDPRRDVDVYLDDAAAGGLRIERVIETHVHADFVSGHLELAARTGAAVSYGVGAEVAFPVEPLHDGQRLCLGAVEIEVLATPGHTPESVCLAVYERADDETPFGVLTGDTLFVGDVGRPDLIAAGKDGLSTDVMARRLYRSLRDKLLQLPDATKVFPAHGAGSSCGRQLSNETSSTVGEQRKTNYALQPMDEDAFVAIVTEGQPVRPPYFAFDARRNREDHPLLDDTAPPAVGLDDALALVAQGAALLDVREPAAFAAGHLRGAVNVGLQGRFAEWAGDVLPDDGDVVLVGDPRRAAEAKLRLGRIGYDRVVGQLADPAGLLADRPDLHEASSRLTIEQFAELRGLEPDLQLVDVRGAGETAHGILAGAREIPLAALTASIGTLDASAPVIVYCASGYRSQIAASVLSRAGFADVSDLLGGFTAWEAAGLPITPASAPDAVDVPHVGPRAARTMVDGGALLLDVREPDEWQGGHAPGAVLVPMSQVHDRLGELPADRPVVVVCRSGGRSATITQSLCRNGYDARNLAGGMSAWSAAGLPLVAPEVDTSRLELHKRDPLNGETSIPALLGGVAMPSTRFYIRNHFDIPRLDPTTWRLAVGGHVAHPLHLALPDLRRMRSHTALVTLECAGNGRSTFDPPVEGEPWRLGAVSTAEWTGVPLVEVLDRAGPTSPAVEVLFRGADRAAAGAAGPTSFERSLSLADARDSGALLAYAMNGDPLPLEHGFPLRLVVPSWYAVASVKWLTDIEVLAAPFEGWFQAQRYVYEREGADGPYLEPLRHQRVRALITEPADGAEVAMGEIAVRGVAWSGEAPIAAVDVMVGDRAWQPARLIGEARPGCWQWWELLTRVEEPGELAVRARATDRAGRTQPERPEWNRLGYGANAIQVVTVRVG
jgi:rhodanese-related sulfurtransferase/DMSO/TMAO reductase YedYZ molybdopterin-dependent catalytic subunit/glyoxylase-like metal-dependent hydrolase (beta-lactamase superfamily II)